MERRIVEHAAQQQRAALRLGFCVGDAQGQGTATFVSTSQRQWGTAVGGEPLDPSRGAVFWKATVAYREHTQRNALMIGVIGNRRPQADSHIDPTHFSWDAVGNRSWQKRETATILLRSRRPSVANMRSASSTGSCDHRTAQG